MPFVLTFCEDAGPLSQPLRHGAVVAIEVNGSVYGARLNLPAGVKTAAMRLPDGLLPDGMPSSFELGKRVFMREGSHWRTARHKSARVYEVPATDTLSQNVVGFYELPPHEQVRILGKGELTENTFVFKWGEMSETAKKAAVDSLKVSRQQQRPRPYPAPRPPAPRPPPPVAPPAPVAPVAPPAPVAPVAPPNPVELLHGKLAEAIAAAAELLTAEPPESTAPKLPDCPICFEHNRTPVALSCGHLVCNDCLPTLVGQCKCPICRSQWSSLPLRIYL